MKREIRFRWKDTPHAIDEERLRELGVRFEVGFFEEVLRKDPHHVGALITLGELYTESGRYLEGLAVDEKLSSLFPYEPTVHYNLACSLSLLERKEEAANMLRKAVNLGFDDFDELEKDSDLDNIRDHPTFIELLLSLRKSNRT
jgi:tetratricopeptide (TPR) repeat protein